MSDERNCATCAHRSAWDGSCLKMGYQCSTEARYGGECKRKGEFTLWEPRRPLLRRVIRFFVGVKG